MPTPTDTEVTISANVNLMMPRRREACFAKLAVDDYLSSTAAEHTCGRNRSYVAVHGIAAVLSVSVEEGHCCVADKECFCSGKLVL